ncbi:MAG: M12 family metallo-peptidase, partial [Gammaproteobacteria bacterium]|nr:M12 family metallo-peptidase [Gammaproteobacteria bacterium]
VTAAAIDPGATATIRIMVVATNQAVTGYGGDMRALVELAVAESNQGYVNSNVGINLVLAGYYTTSYTESGSFNTDLTRFRGTTDGYMDSFHTTRDQIAADVGMLVINNSGSCGLASGIGSTASTAFASAYWDCITGYYSFAHEVGHLQSARHDPAADPTTTPYAYGHGYRAPNNAWRTVMAYNCTASCPRLNYWSNPDVTYGGVPMGTATQSHNQRVLVNTKATIAGFRGTTPPTQTYTNSTDYAINDNATVDSPITVSGRSGNAPSTSSVSVNIVHTYIGDLKVDVVAPDGSLYNIHNRTGSSTDNIVKTVTLNLSAEPLNGTWKLRVNDNANADTGYINSWSITF